MHSCTHWLRLYKATFTVFHFEISSRKKQEECFFTRLLSWQVYLSGECISKIERKSADRTPENGEEVEGCGGEDAHSSSQLEEDSAQLSSSEASGSLFEVQKL
jgi:hypothetical protein